MNDVVKERDELVNLGTQLLTEIKKKNYGMDIIMDTMEPDILEQLEAWFKHAEEFVEKYGLKCQQRDFESNSWIINGERVSKKRIEILLSIISRINNLS